MVFLQFVQPVYVQIPHQCSLRCRRIYPPSFAVIVICQVFCFQAPGFHVDQGVNGFVFFGKSFARSRVIINFDFPTSPITRLERVIRNIPPVLVDVAQAVVPVVHAASGVAAGGAEVAVAPQQAVEGHGLPEVFRCRPARGWRTLFFQPIQYLGHQHDNPLLVAHKRHLQCIGMVLPEDQWLAGAGIVDGENDGFCSVLSCIKVIIIAWVFEFNPQIGRFNLHCFLFLAFKCREYQYRVNSLCRPILWQGKWIFEFYFSIFFFLNFKCVVIHTITS